MKPETILDGLQSLKKAGLFRTPKKFGEIAEFWLQKFKNMSDNQFTHAIDAITDNEGTWPSISTIYKHASTWAESRKEKDACPYCEDTGFLLIRSKGTSTAYACRCKMGQKIWKNQNIASYESLGIPWPEPIEKPSLSKKMSKKNRRLIDTFLGRIGEKIPDVELLEEDPLPRMMVDGSLESG